MEEHDAAIQQHDRDMQQIRELLRLAKREAVQEARKERKRRRELDEKWDQNMRRLSAAQLVTEEKLQGLIGAMRRRGA